MVLKIEKIEDGYLLKIIKENITIEKIFKDIVSLVEYSKKHYN